MSQTQIAAPDGGMEDADILSYTTQPVGYRIDLVAPSVVGLVAFGFLVAFVGAWCWSKIERRFFA